MNIHYNCFSAIAKSALDLPENVYKEAGVSRKNKFDLRAHNVSSGDIIFVKTDFIVNKIFQKYFLPKIENKFILITGTSDYTVSSSDIKEIIDSGKVMHWFACNPPDNYFDKISFLPIGFQEIERIESKLPYIYTQMDKTFDWNKKKNKIYIPYHSSTNSNRKTIIENMKGIEYIDIEEKELSFEEYIEKIKLYKYVLSLRGNGWDCHRNYEILLTDSVPVLEPGPILSHFRRNNIPCFSISDINSSMFNLKYKHNKNILKFSYWKNVILSFK